MRQEFSKANMADALAVIGVYLKEGLKVTALKTGGKLVIETEKVDKEAKK